jgi:hypothetical protein
VARTDHFGDMPTCRPCGCFRVPSIGPEPAETLLAVGDLHSADLGEDRPGRVLGSLLEERPGMALSLVSSGPVPRGNAWWSNDFP